MSGFAPYAKQLLTKSLLNDQNKTLSRAGIFVFDPGRPININIPSEDELAKHGFREVKAGEPAVIVRAPLKSIP